MSTIWNRLPKSIFGGATVLELGEYDTVTHFNIGSGVFGKQIRSGSRKQTVELLLKPRRRERSFNGRKRRRKKKRWKKKEIHIRLKPVDSSHDHF